MAAETGNTYISETMWGTVKIPTINLVLYPRFIVIPTANLRFSTAPRAKKLTPGDCDNNRQLEMAIQTFCSPMLQFLVVDRCRNHLANLLSSSTSSKFPNLAMEFRRYLSEFQRCNYFPFWLAISIFPVFGFCCTHLPSANTVFPLIQYHQNSNGKSTAFDHGKLVGSVTRRF